jgi:hypothetical protein
MMPAAALADPGPRERTLSTGRCFVYLLPCRDEDTLKVGFARDPWVRLQTFHPRFDQFFDLGRGALVETDRVQEARVIESRLKAAFADAATPAPLAVRARAGGRFEWFRGVHAAVEEHLRDSSQHLGYALHAPLDHWLCQQWSHHQERIVDWCRHEYDSVEMLHYNAPPEIGAQRTRRLRERLEIWDGIGIELRSLLPDPIMHWYRYGFSD